jgi:hypothetical protein
MPVLVFRPSLPDRPYITVAFKKLKTIFYQYGSFYKNILRKYITYSLHFKKSHFKFSFYLDQLGDIDPTHYSFEILIGKF